MINTRIILSVLLCIILNAGIIGRTGLTDKTPLQRELLFENSDFELGDLTNWQATGNAFACQPTMGDNPLARGRGQSAKHQGDYWIGTFECYNGVSGSPGSIQGDQAVGTLTSIPFIIKHSLISFLIGGGMEIERIHVALIIEGQEVLRATGRSSSGESQETMEPEIWSVRPWLGKTARIVIRDLVAEPDSWGHINVDHFHYLILK